MVVIALALLGLCFGSFVNALVWRVHEKKAIVATRSQCVRCGHQLSAADLVPILSWVVLRGRCRYCKESISAQYPLVEIVCAAVFVASYYFWPTRIAGGQWVLLATWLAVSVGLLALAVYDLRWMILPSNILYPTAAVAVFGRLVYVVGFERNYGSALLHWALSVLVASGIFWALFMISSGRWIGYGDIRLGLVTGTVLSSPAKSFLMIFLASALGTLFVIPLLITKRQSFSSKLPYGPFLILSTALTLLFGDPIIGWYQRLLM